MPLPQLEGTVAHLGDTLSRNSRNGQTYSSRPLLVEYDDYNPTRPDTATLEIPGELLDAASYLRGADGQNPGSRVRVTFRPVTIYYDSNGQRRSFTKNEVRCIEAFTPATREWINLADHAAKYGPKKGDTEPPQAKAASAPPATQPKTTMQQAQAAAYATPEAEPDPLPF